MKPALAATTSGVAALALAAGACLAVTSDDGAPSTAVRPTSGMVTSFPDLPTPTGDPELAGLRSASPKPGTVARIAGPFDSRFVTRGLAFDGRSVRGAVDITSDVSEVIDLQVLAGFYDASGAYLGQGRWTFHLDEDHEAPHAGPPSEEMAFRVTVPAALAGKAVSAAVGVPVLVNE